MFSPEYHDLHGWFILFSAAVLFYVSSHFAFKKIEKQVEADRLAGLIACGEKPRSWWWKINACETCGERPAYVCGDCRECMLKEFQRAEDEIQRREKQKLKEAVSEVLKEMNLNNTAP